MNNNLKRSEKRGFTLIELLVVIAIIGVLTGVILVDILPSRAKARDAQRVSDVGNIQLALELYFDRCKQYPAPASIGPTDLGLILSTACPTVSTISLSSYIAKIPAPPAGAVSAHAYYDYVVNQISAPSDYVLHTKFEYVNSASPDSLGVLPSGATGYGFVACDNAFDYCRGPKQ